LFIVLAVAVLLVAMIAAGIACDKAKEGELPTLKVGDQWVYEMVSEGVEYAVTWEVTDEDVIEGKDCYVIEWHFDPAFGGIFDSLTEKRDRATYFSLRTQMTGTMMGLSAIADLQFSYTFPEAAPWPLEVGKEIKVIRTETSTTTMMGETKTETETETSTQKVERMEEITVPAGTFKCFKIVKYDETGEKIYTSWHSDKVKTYVKRIVYEDGTTMELKSYSM